ncbi:MAG TPA: hypothetical protein VL132_09680, partial [Planctomycetaceae bacterium]|nr:hypothetical protein [Planctomycetaceae bacterium]
MPHIPPDRDRNLPSQSGCWRSVWILALVTSAGCQSMGLPTEWGVGHAPSALESSPENSSKPAAGAVAKADGETPELVARLRPMLADGIWSLDPAWSLLEATTDPSRFGPAFTPGFRWRFVPAGPAAEAAPASLIAQQRPSLAMPVPTEWDWLFRGGSPPTTAESSSSLVIPALQHLAKESTAAGINASILLWRSFPAQAMDRSDVRE